MSIEIKGRDAANAWKAVKVSDSGELLVTSSPTTGTQSTSNVGSVIKVEWDDFQVIAKNASGSPTLVRYFNDTVQVAQIDLTYDVDGDLQRIQVS